MSKITIILVVALIASVSYIAWNYVNEITPREAILFYQQGFKDGGNSVLLNIVNQAKQGQVKINDNGQQIILKSEKDGE